jgi:outer membrane protein assembly factor BamB
MIGRSSRLHSVLWLVFILFLPACGASPRRVTSVPSASGCSPVGQVHLTSSLARAPSSQGEWPMFHGDLRRNGVVQISDGSLLTPAWSYCTGGPLFSSPIVQNGLVYSASTNKTLTALTIRTGTIVWRFQADSAFYSTPALQNGLLYAASVNGSLYALNAATGQVRWQYTSGIPGAKFWSSPAVADGLVLIGVASSLNEQPKIAGQLLAFDAMTGKRRWQVFTMARGAPGGGIWSSPAIDLVHGVVYVATGDPDDGVQALTLQDGRVLWHWRSVKKDVSDTDIGAGPALYDDQQGNVRVAAGGKDGFIYSLDAQTGQVVWRTHIANQIYSSPAIVQGDLYAVGVLIRSAVSWDLTAQTGAPRWQHGIPMIVYASPAIAGQTLYLAVGDAFGPGDGGVQVVNAATGKLLQFADLQSTVSSSPAVLPGWLFVGAQNGNLYAFTRQG